MATNPYFSQQVSSEQLLFEDIIIESLKLYGQDVYYLPRTIVNEDRILGDDVPSSFNSSYKIEMYIENVDGFDGGGDAYPDPLSVKVNPETIPALETSAVAVALPDNVTSGAVV